MSKLLTKSPDHEPGVHMISRLSPLLISTAAPSAAAMSRHNPNDRAARSPAPPGGTPMLYSKVSIAPEYADKVAEIAVCYFTHVRKDCRSSRGFC